MNYGPIFLPKAVKYLSVLTITRPVTQAVEVVVKTKSVDDIEATLLLSDVCNKMEPNKMTIMKNIIGYMIGEFRISFFSYIH